MDLIIRVARISTVIMAVLLIASGYSAAADWDDFAVKRELQQQDDPAWDQYAFELPFVASRGTLSFVELARDDKPFVLFWWLVDCPLCHLQMPYMQQLDNLTKEYDLGLRIVGINVDMDKSDCEELLEERNISFDVLFDARARRTNDGFDVENLGCPLVYVFDGEGLLVEVFKGFNANIASRVVSALDIEIPEEAELPQPATTDQPDNHEDHRHNETDTSQGLEI